MIKRDYHVHTLYCDGTASAQAMVQSAIDKGMEAIGFSGHAFTSFDDGWCMSLEGTKRYIYEIGELKVKYSGQIDIYCGAEWDMYSEGPRDGFEYLIGAVHYALRDKLRSVDESPETFKRLAAECFSGDYYALAEKYYTDVADVISATGADIIGHFDLITKFNEGDCLFDTNSERYKDAWRKACDKLLKTGKPFEINTGAITRGLRTKPYPSKEITDYIGERGGTFILSSDSHAAGSLLFGFDDIEKYLKEKGYSYITTIFPGRGC